MYAEVKLKGIVRGTIIGGYRLVNRFGKDNFQLYMDLYRGLGRGFWGYVSLDTSPNASFLPRFSLGGGLYRSFSRYELGLNTRYMRFRSSEVLLLTPSLILFPSSRVAVTLNLYVNAPRKTFTLYTRLTYEGDRTELFASASAGNSSERLQAREDFVRYSTYSFGAGLEREVIKNLRIGAFFRMEVREGLYTRRGAGIYGRVSW